jgi:hypothetical protein
MSTFAPLVFGHYEVGAETPISLPTWHGGDHLSRLCGPGNPIDDGEALLAFADRLGLEGVVSKRWSWSYRSGRSRDWVKLEHILVARHFSGGS